MGRISRTVLDNGTKVISEEINHVRSVSFGIWVTCGSRHEDESQHGIAHFVEHMLFKGTKKRTALDIASTIDSVGGVMNAFTSKEFTALYIKVPDYHLHLAVDLLGDIFRNSLFDEKEVEKEKSVILQEIKMLEDSPDDYVHELLEMNFWNGHSLGRPVLGTNKSVEQLNQTLLRVFFETRYGGKNVVISAAGKVNHHQLVDIAGPIFGDKDFVGETVESSRPHASPQIAVIEKDLEQVHLMVGTLAPSLVSEKRFAGFILNAVLGGGMSSRLFQEIREKRGLAYAVHSYLVPYTDTGILGIYVGSGRKEVAMILDLIMEELTKLTEECITEKELESAKELVKGNFILSMESTDNRMTRLAKNEICFGRDIPMEEVLERIDALSGEDIRALAREIMNPSNIGVAAIGPISEKDIVLHMYKV
ncbi:MAG: insulinase family protein [Syntrophales bacterium]|nr:insulinase family protein [Syntrophales bacterium]